MYLCNVMAVTGAFYGVEQSSPTKDIAASFTISLCGTLPVFVLRKILAKSKPLEQKSTRQLQAEAPMPTAAPAPTGGPPGRGATRPCASVAARRGPVRRSCRSS